MMLHTTVRVSARVRGFVYAIRNIVAEARKVEAAGRRVRYLNIGDPIQFGFRTPPHLIEAVDARCGTATTATRRRPASEPAREAVAAEYARRGVPDDARSRDPDVRHL